MPGARNHPQFLRCLGVIEQHLHFSWRCVPVCIASDQKLRHAEPTARMAATKIKQTGDSLMRRPPEPAYATSAPSRSSL